MFVLFVAISPGAAIAADISVIKPDSSSGYGQPIIQISGEFDVDDILEFKQIIKSLPPQTIVSLDSSGGKLLTGIEIGKVIATSGFATSVSNMCASSCALAWLAGTPRIISPSAKVGFHLAYKGDLDKSESGAGNALVGADVSGLGLGENVVRYITSAAPTDIQWLSSRDADLLGIDIVVDEDAVTRNVEREAYTSEADAAEIAEAAIEFIKNVIFSSTYSDAKALDAVRRLYANKVFYFGEMKSKEDVYTDKLKYLKRWPFRTVSLREHTISASCKFTHCKVTGIYDWGVGNAKGRKKSGAAVFVYEFEVNETILITSEGGEVLSRY